MKRRYKSATSSREISSLGYGTFSLLLLGSCSRTFVTNNYHAPDRDAATIKTAETTASTTEAGIVDGQVDASNLDAAVVDASASVDAGVDAKGPPPVKPPVADAEADAKVDAADAAPQPLAPSVPVVNATISDQQLNVFGTFDNHYWFIASQSQVDAINKEFQGGGGGWGGYGGYGGDIYAPNSGEDTLNAVEHLVVTTPDGKTVDYGQMKVKLVGQSTGRTWTETTLPNFKLDADDITSGMLLGGYEHFRLNNAVVGTIFREKFVYDLYYALGYPAPLSSYAWVSTTVWDPSAKVPYIVTESYKRGFCRNRPELGGECPNMWEFASDFGYGSVFDSPDNCQFEECDSTRALEFENAVTDARNGGGTTLADIGEYLDWDKFHEFHCLAWIFGTTDSPPLTSNNTVWAERADGKFQMFPYSIDISLSLGSRSWWDPGLYGGTVLAQLCNQDEECWADTIAVCEEMVDKFTAINPVARLDKLHADLDAAGMLRSGDEGRYNDLRLVLNDMLDKLPQALDSYREIRDPYDYCGNYGMVDCGGSCQYVEYCYLCDDAYYEGMNGGGPVVLPAGAATTAVGDVAPTGPVEGTTGVEVDGGATYVEVDAGDVPTKPDFCYRYDQVKDQKAQAVYELP